MCLIKKEKLKKNLKGDDLNILHSNNTINTYKNQYEQFEEKGNQEQIKKIENQIIDVNKTKDNQNENFSKCFKPNEKEIRNNSIDSQLSKKKEKKTGQELKIIKDKASGKLNNNTDHDKDFGF